jgi:threonine synthase
LILLNSTQEVFLQPVHLECVLCGATYPPDPAAGLCPRCARDLNRPGILDLVFDPEAFRDRAAFEQILTRPRREDGLWAYAELLPVDPGKVPVTLGEGGTPLTAAPALAASAGVGSVHIKNECLNPTGSFKDRIAALVVAKALEAGARTMVLVSSGNMAVSTAAYGALAGLKTVVIVSPSVRRERILQIALYGATVLRVKGTSADRLGLCLSAVDRFGWYNGNSPYNPYGPHGAKTISYEIFLQGGREGFDWIISPVGFGCNIVGNWKGFQDLVQLGRIARIPRFAAVQTEGSPSLVKAFEQGLMEAVPGPQETIAGGLSQVVTLNSVLALRALRDTDGTAVAVSDSELLNAIPQLAREAGIFAEPSGVAAVAGLRRLVANGTLRKSDRVLLLISGSGLKDPLSSSALNVPELPELDPSLDALERYSGNRSC